MSCREWYRWFGEKDAVGRSPSYARLAVSVADDPELCAWIDELAPDQRQPNLLFAAVRYLGGPTNEWSAFRSFVADHWSTVADIMATHFTQTNEAARCAALLPVLAEVPGPIALIELGTSAGLCLYPDRYGYRYDGRRLGTADPVIEVACSGPVPIPDVMPEVVSRTGIDRAPRDVTDPEDLRWLRACIWPEQVDRQRRFDAAAAVVAADPPQLVTGDLVACLPDVLADVPMGVTPVVIHSVVLFYLDEHHRHALADVMAVRPDVPWLSLEAPHHVPGIVTDERPPPEHNQDSYLVVGRRGRGAVGFSDPHVSWLHWRP